jgi:hypothetical protein
VGRSALAINEYGRRVWRANPDRWRRGNERCANGDESSTDRETFIPFLAFDQLYGSSTDDPTKNYVTSLFIEPEPSRSNTSDPRACNILTYNKSYNILNSLFIGDPIPAPKAPSCRYVVRLLRENTINDTINVPIVFNISGTTFNIPDDISEASVEAEELVAAFLEDVQTDETLERCELMISDIIDRYGKGGVAAVEAQVFDEPAVGPLAWKFLNALGVRRGQPIDDVARAILLSNLDSTSAGCRSAAASALGSFPDGVVLAALERRAAIEKNRMVLATLNAHIRTLRRDALSTAKIF